MIYGWALCLDAWQSEGYNVTHPGRGGDKKHWAVGHKRSWCSDLLPFLRSCLLWVHRARGALNLADSNSPRRRRSSRSSVSWKERGKLFVKQAKVIPACVYPPEKRLFGFGLDGWKLMPHIWLSKGKSGKLHCQPNVFCLLSFWDIWGSVELASKWSRAMPLADWLSPNDCNRAVSGVEPSRTRSALSHFVVKTTLRRTKCRSTMMPRTYREDVRVHSCISFTAFR